MYAVQNHAFATLMYRQRIPTWRRPKEFFFNLLFGMDTKPDSLVRIPFQASQLACNSV
jgi:hypothetical protein